MRFPTRDVNRLFLLLIIINVFYNLVNYSDFGQVIKDAILKSLSKASETCFRNLIMSELHLGIGK